MQLLISDANVLIDLEEGGLLDALFAMPWQSLVPDLLFADELAEEHSDLPARGLQLGQLLPEAMLEAQRLAATYRGPSRYDCFAMALAKQENCPLLTGDADLREAADRERVIVVGTLWLVEEMVRQRVVDIDAARAAYMQMQAGRRRLPWPQAFSRLDDLERDCLPHRDPFEEMHGRQ